MYTSRDLFQFVIDKLSFAVKVIDYQHAEIHSGDHYFVAGYGTYAADGDVDFQVTTPAGEQLHMRFDIQSTGATVFSIYEGATVGTGTPVTAYNNNRNSSNTSGATIQTDGAITAAGTLIFSQAWGVTGNPTQRKGGSAEDSGEIVLRESTTYRFFIESNSADNIISYQGYWYEHTPR